MNRDLISSPVSTGGAGTIFEQHVNAYWLALLLVRARPPILSDCTVEEVHLQTSHLGWHTDDFLICCQDGSGQRRKLASQVKRTFTVSASNSECKKAIQDFWQDFSNPQQFSPDSDRFALVTQLGTITLLQHFTSLLNCARASRDAADFEHRLNTPGFINRKSVQYCDEVRKIIGEIEEKDISVGDIWPFLCVLHVLSLDLASASRQNEATIKNLLTLTSGKPVEAGIAEATWDALLRVAGEGMSEARSYQHENLPEKLRQRHTQIGDTEQHELRALSERSVPVLDEIRSTIGDVHLDQTFDPGALNEAVNKFEVLSQEAKEQMTAGFADMRAELRTLTASIATQEGQPDSEQQRLSEKIDSARDLIQQGLIATARQQLERIEREAEQLPDNLRFHLLTNLAICAMGEDKLDAAISFINQAHRIQPENRTGIINAAMAAELQQNPERAAELARKALTLDPHDPSAAANLISALWSMGKNEELEDFVASAEWMTKELPSALALARVRVQQARYDDAKAVYRSLIDTDPGDAQTHLCLSQCLLAQAQVERLPVAYSKEDLARLREAEIEADRAVELLRPTQLSALRHQALVLRAGARALLGNVDEAMGDVDEVLREAPQHPAAALHKGLLLLKKGPASEARRFIEGIQDPEVRSELILPLADACLESGDPTAAIDLLRGSFKLNPPEKEDFGRAQSLLQAEAAAGIDDSVGPLIAAAIERFPDDPTLFALAAVRSSLREDTEAAESALNKAVDLADAPFRQVLQGQLGRLYEGVDRFADAAEQFSKACGDDPAHPDAVPMLLSLSNSGQYRKALDLARKIRDVVDPIPRIVFEVEAAILGYVGDVRAEVLRHHELCSREDTVPGDRVRLASAQIRCGEREAALETVLNIDVSGLGHASHALMNLAIMKCSLGAAGYMNDAYLARRYGLRDPAVHLAYVGLFQGWSEDWEEPVVVEPGCSVRIKDEEQWWHILEDGEEPNGPQELPPDSGLAQRLLGRSVGDVIVRRQALGDVSYEIAELQSKYVRAFQETYKEFSIRFPDDISLSLVEMDSNFTPIFQSIELRHQHISNVESLYKSRQLPFASFCSLIGNTTLTAWPEYTALPDRRLHFGTGSDQETYEAGELLRDADAIVLNMVALLTVHKLRLADPLRTRFSRITIPQLVFDEIQHDVDRMKIEPAPSGYMRKDGEGRYRLTEMTDEVWEERQAYARAVLELADTFERIPSYSILDTDDPEEAIEVLTPAGAGAIFAGDEQSEVRPVLISDDLPLSDVARSLGFGAVNSQALLTELLRSDVITEVEYSSKIEELVLMNYWFVRISAEDILWSLEANGYQTSPGTRAMLRTLGGPDCSEEAAASVGAEVISSLAKRPLIQQQFDLLLSSVLTAICQGRHTDLILLEFKAEIAARLALVPLQRARILQAVDFFMWSRSL